MITAGIVFNKSHLISELLISGHAAYAVRGEDIVCSAVSILADAFAVVLAKRDGIDITVSTVERGDFYAAIECSREAETYMAPVQDYLITGLQSVSKEFPDNLKLIITDKWGVG
jgi:uncharacterized protein YsxB (DUF464 family)